MSNTKYIILGGKGFIGTNLTKHFNAGEGIIIGRNLPLPGKGTHKYFSIQQYSLREIAEMLRDRDNYIVIDLSYNSISNTNPVHPGKDFSENLNLVIDNLHFAKNLNAAKYIYLSSGGTVYGRTSEKLILESHPTNPVSHYGIIKLAAEKYVQMFCGRYDMRFHIVRPSNVYGPGQIPFRGQGIVSTALASAMTNRPFSIYGKGDIIRDYIYVDDFCQWLIKIIESGENGEIYNAGSGHGRSINEMIEKISKTVDLKSPLNLDYGPERPFDVKINVLNNWKIVDNTGMSDLTELEEGIKRTWEWIKQYDYNR